MALGWLAQGILGTSTLVTDLTCIPTGPASLNVQVTKGQIFSLQATDTAAYSSLTTDAHQILKQGLLLDTATLGITPPGTIGFSQNYLIQAAFSETDAGSTTLPYYNPSNPAVAWSGPSGSGTPQFTVRKNVLTVGAKAGTAATSGTQTTPAPDAGYVGLFVVTVANGATSISSGNISQLATAPMLATNGQLPLIPFGVQQQTWTAYDDTGAADALVISPTPAPAAYAKGQRFLVKKTAAANATATPTLNITGPSGTLLGAKTIVDRRGTALVAGDLPASAELDLEYDGTNFRNLGVVQADLGVLKSLSNVDPRSTTTRVSMSGSAGNSYTVTAWTPANYVKKSPTSNLLVMMALPSLTPNVPAGGVIVDLTIGGQTVTVNASNSQNNATTVQSAGPTTLFALITGLSAGSKAISVTYRRADSTDWTTVFCPNSGDVTYYGATSLASMIIGEVEP